MPLRDSYWQREESIFVYFIFLNLIMGLLEDRSKTLLRFVRETLKSYIIASGLALIVIFIIPSWIWWISVYVGSLVFLTSIIAPFVNDWRPRPRTYILGRAVFISGCDSGFGHMLALRLDKIGIWVFAGCLFPEGDGAQALKNSASSQLHIVPLDVTSDESVAKARDYVASNLMRQKLWGVINNAGINDGAELFWTNTDVIHRVMDINTFGVVRVTKAFLPLVCQASGRIIAVASAAGRYTYPGMVPYCMSKQSVISFCDGLRLEMYRFGIKVVTVEPWMFKTPITNDRHILSYITKTWDKAPEEIKNVYPQDYLSRYKRQTLRFINWSISNRPEEVVDCLEEAFLAIDPKYSYTPGPIFSRIMFWFLQRLPKPFADLLICDHCEVKIN